MIAGWMNRQQQEIIEYLQAENDIFRKELQKATGRKRIILGAYLFSGNNTNPGDFLGINRISALSAYEIVYVNPPTLR